MSNRWVFHNGSLPPGSALLPEVKYKVIYGWRKMHKSPWIIFHHPFLVVVYLGIFFFPLKMNKLEKMVVSPLGMEIDVPSARLLLLMATDLWGDAAFPTRNGNWDISIEKIPIPPRSSSLWQAISVKFGQRGHKSGHLTACDTLEKRKQIASSRNANIFQHLTSQADRDYSSVNWERRTGEQTKRLAC